MEPDDLVLVRCKLKEARFTDDERRFIRDELKSVSFFETIYQAVIGLQFKNVDKLKPLVEKIAEIRPYIKNGV